MVRPEQKGVTGISREGRDCPERNENGSDGGKAYERGIGLT